MRVRLIAERMFYTAQNISEVTPSHPRWRPFCGCRFICQSMSHLRDATHLQRRNCPFYPIVILPLW